MTRPRASTSGRAAGAASRDAATAAELPPRLWRLGLDGGGPEALQFILLGGLRCSLSVLSCSSSSARGLFVLGTHHPPWLLLSLHTSPLLPSLGEAWQQLEAQRCAASHLSSSPMTPPILVVDGRPWVFRIADVNR
jgi:hypothetical protein